MSSLTLEEVRRRKRGRLQFLLVAFLFIAPPVTAYLLYYVWPPRGGTANAGELVVQPLPAITLKGADGAPLPLERFKGKWLLLTVDGPACQARCEKKMYVMQRAHLIQGKHRDRIARLLVLSGMSGAVPSTAGELSVASDADGALAKVLPAKDPVENYIYLIDPLGNLVTRYSADMDPKKLAKDLRLLLQASQIG